MEKSLCFRATLQPLVSVNPEFAKAKVRVCYTGENRNNTLIADETLQKMIPSIYGIPVVGEYKEEEGTFGGHGGKVEIDDEGIRFIDTTRPYGFVDPTTPVTFETVKENDGITENEYLVCYVYLWCGRYPELQTVLDNGAGQSMEIKVTDGEVDDRGVYEIKEAIFSALCILGNCEPCFESSNITTNFSKEEAYKEMINTFNKYNNSDNKGEDKKNKEEEDNKIDYKNLYDNLLDKFNQINSENSEKDALIEELKKYKKEIELEQRRVSEEKLFEKYSALSGTEGFEEIKNNTSQYDSIETIEKELALLFANNIFANNANANKKDNVNVVKISMENCSNDNSNKKYGDLFDKYLNK